MDTETTAEDSAEDGETDFGVTEENGIFFWVLLVTFCLIFVFASVDIYNATALTMYLSQLFTAGRMETGAYISVLDGLVLIFSLTLLLKYGVDYVSTRSILKVIFVSAVICWLLNLLNPNDRSRVTFLGLPLIAEFAAYPYLFFMFTVFFMQEKAFTVLSRRIFLVTAWCIVLRSVILLVFWARGEGNSKFYGVNSTLTEGDSLFIFAFFQSVFFAVFLLGHKRAALVAWLLTLAIPLLSYRRSALLVGLIVNAGTLTLHIFFAPNRKSMLRGVFAGALVVIIGYAVTTSLVSPEVLDNYVSRYLGVFSDDPAHPSASDTGHFQQTTTTFLYAMQKMEFWGFGYGDPSRVNVPGAAAQQYVHNVYAAAWLHHGIFMFFFYVMLLGTGLVSLVTLVLQHLHHDWPAVLLTGTILVYFVSLCVFWLFSPLAMAEALRMRLFWVFLLAFVFKMGDHNYRQLFSETVEIGAAG